MTEYKALNTIAYEHLRRMIYSSELEFNKFYSETKLAAQLSISRTPIRDALNRLAQERYIDILPNRGFRLHTPTQGDIYEAFHVRMMIESYCAKIVSRHYPDAPARTTVARMEDAMDMQRNLLEDDTSYSLGQFWLDDIAFHKATLEYLNITSVIKQYESFMYIFMPHHLIRESDTHQKQPATLERHRSTLVEHAAITEAIKSHDEERIQKAIQSHLDSSLKALYVRMED
ncbi:MAG: GntR family transcriptional regulator [Clostridia bacterium]|nr:GntR family transcriptional regulator [Clostridia bacterium]MBQ6120563.1 GntR family transcriptional regulator [Clostridia bacterium]MBQ6324849.1 GntR family transcriptional regulator [Clostridia bacterium]